MNRSRESEFLAAEHRADLIREIEAARLVQAVSSPRSTRAFLLTLGTQLNDLLDLMMQRQRTTSVLDVEPTEAGPGSP